MTILAETTTVSPALVSFGRAGVMPALYVSWTGTDPQHSLNVLGTHNPGVWPDSQKITLPQQDLDGPALAGGPALFAAWTGVDAQHHLNVIRSYDGREFQGKVTLGETSNFGPALAYSDGALYIAWTGTDGRLNVASSFDEGKTFGNKVTLAETSGAAPAIAAAGRTLYLSWSGTDQDHHLNVIESKDGGRSWVGKVTLGETTTQQPALAVTGNAAHGTLYVAWTGTDSDHHLNYLHSPTDHLAFSGKQTIADTSIAGPALGVYNQHVYISWAGTDPEHHLNVAPL